MPRPDKDKLLDACIKHTRHQEDGVVISEAYIPYIPDNWNGYLVLAEAQNLSSKNGKYIQSLEDLEPRARMDRLNSNTTIIGVGPWDDGSLKLAVESAFSIDSARTAVSNAIPWSRVSDNGNNANPTTTMERWSIAFWQELLPVIKPSRVIVSGRAVDRVIRKADPTNSYCRTYWCHPTSRNLSAVSGMAGELGRSDLLARFPEVRNVVSRHPEWDSTSQIVFACLAVSSTSLDTESA